MSTNVRSSEQEVSSIPSVLNTYDADSSSTTPLNILQSPRDFSLKAHSEGAPADKIFCSNLEGEEGSIQRGTFHCDHLESEIGEENVEGLQLKFSNSLDSDNSSDDTAVDSDTGSFFSVNSQLTPRSYSGEPSLTDTEYFSESAVYNSAQSLITPTPSSHSSFLSLKSYDESQVTESKPSYYQEQFTQQLEIKENHSYSNSDLPLDYTSCPDLSPTGLQNRKRHSVSSGVNLIHVSQPINKYHLNCHSESFSESPLFKGKKFYSSSMSSFEGSASPKVGEEVETKKKKGLMSSFRKSRKTSRKLRQQKKAAADADSSSINTAVTSDGEHELTFDSESSVPNSPLPIKSKAWKADTNSTENANDKSADGGLDFHQATHERLNGRTSPKDSSEPNSKSSSPLLTKGNRIAETAKKFEEKEEKKVSKNKFGSSLFRKKKSDQMSSSSLISDISADLTEPESSYTKDPERKSQSESLVSDDSLLAQTDDMPISEQATNADPKSSSFRSYISSVQLVKNWTVNADMPKPQQSLEVKGKTGLDSVDGEKTKTDSVGTAPEEKATTTIETKKITTSSANGSPSTTEVTSKKTTVTILTKQSPTLKSSPTAIANRSKTFTSPPSPKSTSSSNKFTFKTNTVNTSPKSPKRTKSPSPVIPKRLPLEVKALPSKDNIQPSTGNDKNVPVKRQPPPPVTITPPDSSPEQAQTIKASQSQFSSNVGNIGQSQKVGGSPPASDSQSKAIKETVLSKKTASKELNEPNKGSANEQQQNKKTNDSVHSVEQSKPMTNDLPKSKLVSTNEPRQPSKVPSNEPLQPSKTNGSKPLQPKKIQVNNASGGRKTTISPDPVLFPASATPGMSTPPSSPEGHPGRDARETPEGDRTENEKQSLLESTGLTDSWAGTSTDKREHLYKILVIGELGTGKTSIIKRYVHQFFSQHYRATIGVDFALKVLNWDNNTVIRLQLWDIAGQERFGNMTRVYYKEAVGAFVVFDVTRAQTFDAVTKWKTDLDTKVTLADGSPIPTVLLANKCDQPKEGVVNNPARMDDYCRERGFSGWFETSAKENINIDEASRFLVNKILTNERQGMMMTESLDTDKFSVDGKANPVDKSGCRC